MLKGFEWSILFDSEILEELRAFKLSILFDPGISLIEIGLEEKNQKCKDSLQRMYIAEFVEIGNK